MLVLFFRRKRKELKESITHPRPSLKGGMQPLLLVALSLRYAQTIKGLAWIILMGQAPTPIIRGCSPLKPSVFSGISIGSRQKGDQLRVVAETMARP